jgi:hypothetical protein
VSLRERQLWIGLAVSAAVWLAYGAWFLRRLSGLDLATDNLAQSVALTFLLALVAVVLVEAAFNALVAVASRDRRDGAPAPLAAFQASHLSLMIAVGLLVLLSIVLFVLGLFGARLEGISPANACTLAAHGLAAVVIGAEFARAGLTLWLLRRGGAV